MEESLTQIDNDLQDNIADLHSLLKQINSYIYNKDGACTRTLGVATEGEAIGSYQSIPKEMASEKPK